MHVEQLDGDKIFVIHNFLSPAECEQYIAASEGIGYIDAPITTAGGFIMRKDIRDNERVIHDDPVMAAELWERAKPVMPAKLKRWNAVGLNERFRYYRYDVGQKFARHYDGCYERSNGERSFLTFMVYLNGGCEGGDTVFHHCRPSLRICPELGKALVFIHDILHEGAPVTKGRKYVLRTDVMYLLGE